MHLPFECHCSALQKAVEAEGKETQVTVKVTPILGLLHPTSPQNPKEWSVRLAVVTGTGLFYLLPDPHGFGLFLPLQLMTKFLALAAYK